MKVAFFNKLSWFVQTLVKIRFDISKIGKFITVEKYLRSLLFVLTS